MVNVRLFLGLFLGGSGSLFLSSCGKKSQVTTQVPSLKKIYRKGYEALKKGEYQEAIEAFDEVDLQYPYSPWAVQSQVLAAYSAYKGGKPLEALPRLEAILETQPSFKHVDYVHYLRCLCYYKDVPGPRRDLQNAGRCLESIDQMTELFLPSNPYSKDLQAKRKEIQESLAAKEVFLGLHHMKRQYFLSAYNYFKRVYERYPQSLFIPEALYRLVECQLALGICFQGLSYEEVLSRRFPNSSWTKKAQALVKGRCLKPGPRQC